MPAGITIDTPRHDSGVTNRLIVRAKVSKQLGDLPFANSGVLTKMWSLLLLPNRDERRFEPESVDRVAAGTNR